VPSPTAASFPTPMNTPTPIHAFGPEAIKAMGEAFDQAWIEVAANFGSPLEVEKARAEPEP
jgi:hypothetical protein